jgi:hypothetical protein
MKHWTPRGRRFAAALVAVSTTAAILVLHACGDGGGPSEPDPPEDTSGVLTVRLTAPSGADPRAVMIEVSGPAVDSLTAPGLQLWEDGSSTRRVILVGSLASGPILRLHVPDVGAFGAYTARVLQVADGDHALDDAAEYAAEVESGQG